MYYTSFAEALSFGSVSLRHEAYGFNSGKTISVHAGV